MVKHILNTIKRKVRQLVLGVDISNYYFSQGGEDAILRAIFRIKLESGQRGFFVDVGAYHPYKDSNTYLLYRNSWRGINIDATPGSMSLFNKLRPRDINIETGIGKEAGILDYYWISEDSTMNSFSKKNLEGNGMWDDVKKTIPIKVVTLKDVFEQHKSEFTEIDLLSVDVEGMDFEVLSSNDFEKYKPKVIVVELDSTTLEDLESNRSAIFLKSKGYTVIAKNVIVKNVASVFFVDSNYKY